MKGKANIFLSLFLGASLVIFMPGEAASQEPPGILSAITGGGLFGGPSAPSPQILSERISSAADEIVLEISNLEDEILKLQDKVAELRSDVEEELEDRVEDKEDEEKDEEIKDLQKVIDSLKKLRGENIYPLEDELKKLVKEASNLKVQALNINSKEHELAGSIRKKEKRLMERVTDLGEKADELISRKEEAPAGGTLGFLAPCLGLVKQFLPGKEKKKPEKKPEKKELTPEEKVKLNEGIAELRKVADDLEDELDRLEKEKMDKLREYGLMEEVGELRDKVDTLRKKAGKLKGKLKGKKEEAPAEKKGICGSLLGQLSPSEDSGGGGILGFLPFGKKEEKPEVKGKPTPESSLADRTLILKGDIGGIKSSIPPLVEDVEEYIDDFSSAARGRGEEAEAIEDLIYKMDRGGTEKKVSNMTKRINGGGKKGEGLIEEGEDLAKEIEDRVEAPAEERTEKMKEVKSIVAALKSVATAEAKIAKTEEKKAKMKEKAETLEGGSSVVESLYELLEDMAREIASE